MAATMTHKRGMTKTERHNQVLGLLFVSPWLIGFCLFALFPLAVGQRAVNGFPTRVAVAIAGLDAPALQPCHRHHR